MRKVTFICDYCRESYHEEQSNQNELSKQLKPLYVSDACWECHERAANLLRAALARLTV